MDNFLLIAVTIVNLILAISVSAFGFGLIGLAFLFGSNFKEGRSFAFKLFGSGWAGFAVAFIAGYILTFVYAATSYPVLLILAVISIVVTIYSFRKAKEYKNIKKA